MLLGTKLCSVWYFSVIYSDIRISYIYQFISFICINENELVICFVCNVDNFNNLGASSSILHIFRCLMVLSYCILYIISRDFIRFFSCTVSSFTLA